MGVLAALTALSAIVPQRFATWDVTDLRRYAAANPAFTRLAMLDTSLVMIASLRGLLEEKVRRFRGGAALLGLAVAATTVGTLLS